MPHPEPELTEIAANLPIVLVGPMGVGKTTVGKKLAKSLKVAFIDTDAMIVSEHGDIPKIFELSGEQVFREYEEIAVASALKQRAVIATGGGAVLSEKTRALFSDVTVIYLSSDGRHMGSRLKNGKRPLISNGIEDWKRIYEERKPIYAQVADFELMVSGLSLSATLAKIKEFLGAN